METDSVGRLASGPEAVEAARRVAYDVAFHPIFAGPTTYGSRAQVSPAVRRRLSPPGRHVVDHRPLTASPLCPGDHRDHR